MNIAFVTPHFWPWFDRAGRVIGQLAVELLDRGHRPTVLTRRPVKGWPAEITYQGVPVVRFFRTSEKNSARRQYQKTLNAWLDTHRDSLDLVCVSGLGEDAQIVLATFLEGKRCPVVLRAERAGQEGDCLRQIETRRARAAKRLCMKAAAWIGTSATSHAELLAAGYPRDRVVAIPNGVTLRPHRTQQTCLAARRALADADPNLMVLENQGEIAIYVGRLTSRRRLRLLVLAWREIVASHPQAKLWIVGDGPELPTLRHLIDQNNLAWSVQTPGVFDEPELLYDAADLFLHPGIDDDRSGGILEAIAAELPIVATDTSTNRQLLGEHDTLVPGPASDQETYRRWVAAIDRALTASSPVVRPNMASLCIHRTAESHERLFMQLLAEPDPLGT